VARASRRRSWLPAGKFGRVGGGSFQLVSQGAPIKATLLSLERELRIRVSRPSFEGGDFILPSDETEALDINWARDSPVMRTLFPSFAINDLRLRVGNPAPMQWTVIDRSCPVTGTVRPIEERATVSTYPRPTAERQPFLGDSSGGPVSRGRR